MKKRSVSAHRGWQRSLDVTPALLVVGVALAAAALSFYVRSAPAMQRQGRPAAGVQLAGRPLSQLDVDAVRTQVTATARLLPSRPEDARLLPAGEGVMPEVAAVDVDVEATVAAILRASAGADVPFAAAIREPEITLLDLEPQPIRQGNPAKAQVSLAINVAWGNEYLPRILDVLARHQVKASFFLVGSWARKYPELAREIAIAGHEIASHGQTTVDYQGLSEEQLLRQIEESERAIVETTGQRPALFSPHKGDWTPELLALLRQREYLPIHWTVDTVDWKNPSPSEMNRRVLSKVAPGSIILMHPTRPIAEGLDDLLTGLEGKGLQVVTIGTLLDPNPLKRD